MSLCDHPMRAHARVEADNEGKICISLIEKMRVRVLPIPNESGSPVASMQVFLPLNVSSFCTRL